MEWYHSLLTEKGEGDVLIPQVYGFGILLGSLSVAHDSLNQVRQHVLLEGTSNQPPATPLTRRQL